MLSRIFLGIILIVLSIPVLSQDYHNRKVDPQVTDCHKLPTSFESIKEAIQFLENATYRFTEQFKTGKSSGVIAAKFYSCNNEIGYLAIKIDGKYTIYRGMTKEIWAGLTNSNDLDKYFKNKIKGKLQLSVREE